jgi:branched-chain amino acid transport system substrate-binding protein
MNEKEKINRRDYLKYTGAAIGGLVVGGALGYLLKPAEVVEKTATVTVPGVEKTVTVTAPGVVSTVTVPGATVTAPRTITIEKPKKGIPSEPLKIGLTTFLTGTAALEGTHAEATAEILVEEINAAGGILGRKVELLKVDEAIGADALIKAVRKLVTEDKVEFLVGLVSSGNGTALAPVIENELQVPTVYGTATTRRLFEEVIPKPKFVFRTSNYDPMECIAAAKIVLKYFCPGVKRIAGINPDYAFGRDEWEIFSKALMKLKPDVEIVYEGWAPLGTTDFTPHISAILASKPDLVFTSFFAGDLITLVKQAGPMGLFKATKVVASVGGSAYSDFKKEFFPEGVLMGTRQCFFTYPPKFPPMEEFVRKYYARTKRYPIYTGMGTWHGIMAFKTAIELGYELLGEWPDVNTIVKLMERMSMITPVGYRFIRPDHQTVGYQVYGITKHVPEYDFVVLDPMYIYPPEEIAPPVGVKTLDWINTW